MFCSQFSSSLIVHIAGVIQASYRMPKTENRPFGKGKEKTRRKCRSSRLFHPHSQAQPACTLQSDQGPTVIEIQKVLDEV